jgi:hypothetical protein
MIDYFTYRAEVLNDTVQPQLMNAAKGRALYDQMLAKQ